MASERVAVRAQRIKRNRNGRIAYLIRLDPESRTEVCSRLLEIEKSYSGNLTNMFDLNL